MQTEVFEATEATAAGTTAPAATPVKRPWRRRQRYWVDLASQLPITALGMVATLFFVVMFNVTLRELSASRREQIATAAPEVVDRLQAEDHLFHRTIAGLSSIFIICVGFGMVVLTQRSAGPAVRIGSHLQRAARGDLDHRVTLRRRDHFQPLAASCNLLFEALQRQRQEDAARFERLALTAESATTPTAARALAAELRACAQGRR